MEQPIVNLTYLKQMAGGDVRTEIEMIHLIVDNISTQTDELKEAVEQAYWIEIKEKSHYLKSTFNFIGNQKCLEYLAKIESLAEKKTGLNLIRNYSSNINLIVPEIKLALLQILEANKID